MTETRSLGREPTRTHTKEVEKPIDHIEDQSSHSDGANGRLVIKVSDNGQIHDAKQGHSDISDDAWDGDS